jgi:hypothetical protein
MMISQFNSRNTSLGVFVERAASATYCQNVDRVVSLMSTPNLMLTRLEGDKVASESP